jgi:HPt (histidine-containing phosphotransfer) domain-containing protein
MDEQDALARLRLRFVERMRADVERLETQWGPPSGCKEEPRGAMIRLAHGLSGSGASFGFADVSARAAALEVALEEGGEADAAWRDLLIELRRAIS